jgi:uncharacterized SAM-binding protein YcdF (DUF218 family)
MALTRAILLKYRWHIQIMLLIAFLGYLPLQLIMANLQTPTPEAILTLGGDGSREAFTAEFAKTHGNLPIWISSGMEVEKANRLFRAAGINPARVHYDRQAIDTVTNLTTLVEVLEQRQIHHIYLITSTFHMPRASAIATIILGHRGIRFTPISVPSPKPQESPLRVLRDLLRSILWVFTGFTGAEFRDRDRIAQINYHIFGSNDIR